jgi:hypothetical protein
MAINRCQQILTAVDNNIIMATYQIFCECQTNKDIEAKDWEQLTTGLNDEDRQKLDGVVGNLTSAWQRSAPCANLVALARWRRDARGIMGRS